MIPPLVLIADDDLLYRRIYVDYIREDGTLTPTAFMLRSKAERGVSVDLARLTTAGESFARAKEPAKNGLGSLLAGVPRQYNLGVEHTPEPQNYSHAEIVGDITRILGNHLARATTLIRRPTTANA